MDSFKPIDPKLIDVVLDEHDGYPADLAAEDTRDVLWDVCGSASRDFPRSLWIEEKDWADKARENDINKTWPVNFIDRYTHQGNSHECTAHSYSRNFEGARNRARGIIYPDGPKVNQRYEESTKSGSVWISPMSLYSEANPRQWGGANVRQIMEIAVRRGALPDRVQPAEYGFKHTLAGTAGGNGATNQSTGSWVAVRNFPDGWQETAKHFKPLEVVFPSSWQEAVCLVLHGYFVSVGRSGHAVPWSHWNPTSQAMGYVDSYNRILYDSSRTVRSAWGGSFSIITTTTPDVWSKPAG